MSEAPSWLTEENISTATKVMNNPAAQKAAKNPKVQAAAKDQIKKEAPGWTNEDVNNDIEKGKSANTAPPPPKAAAAKKSAPLMNTDMSDVDPEVMKAMQRHHLMLRVLYMGAAVFLSTAAALSLSSQDDLGLIFFAFYVLFFSALVCCFEVALTVRNIYYIYFIHLSNTNIYIFLYLILLFDQKQAISRLIAVNFGFMYNIWGRMMFIILLGFMAFLLSVLGKVAMGFLYAVLLFHFYVMYKFPRFEEYLRKKHYFEGRKAEAAAGK